MAFVLLAFTTDTEIAEMVGFLAILRFVVSRREGIRCGKFMWSFFVACISLGCVAS